jgi:hypothetical protein
VGPSTVAILCYLIYNKLTVGVGMPLSGATKSGFVGFLAAYLTAAIHFPPLFELKALLTRKPSEAAVVFSGSFRFLEVLYPFVAAAFGAVAIWKSRRKHLEAAVLFAVCIYIIFKTGYNFLNVHPWHQCDWYYMFITLSLSVLGAIALRKPWASLDKAPVAKYGIVTIYMLVVLFTGSQYYASLVYTPKDPNMVVFWQRHEALQKELTAHGVTGIINVDDGITAFLLDFPDMHGFAFATDVDAQRAYRKGSMLSLAYSRGINTIAGADYLSADNPPQTDADIRKYLRNSLAWDAMKSEMDKFDFALAYYDPAMKMPFFSFKPKAQ